jgi:glucose uptake protein GlcU
MNSENPKPSEVVYVFLHAIATLVVNIVKLVAGCIWLIGDRGVKLVSTAKADSEND